MTTRRIPTCGEQRMDTKAWSVQDRYDGADYDSEGLSDREEAGAEGSAGLTSGDQIRCAPTHDDGLDDQARCGWSISRVAFLHTGPNEGSEGDGLHVDLRPATTIATTIRSKHGCGPGIWTRDDGIGTATNSS